MKIRYILYARKSSESVDRQMQSIEDQINRSKELARNKKLNIIKTYTESKSAKAPNTRTEFNKMLEDLNSGEADGILCWKFNRLSRNPIDSGTIQYMLQRKTIKSIQTSERELLPEDNALLFSLISGMANQFILDLRKDVKRGLDSKVEKGWYPQLAPLGYLNDKENHTIIKDPDRFQLVRKMWDLMLTGNYSPPQILNIANNNWGFRTKKYSKYGGNKLSRSYIYKIFNNIFYTGRFEYNGEVHEGKHTRMVSDEEFERVQLLLKSKAKAKRQKHDFAFTGLIRCGECDCLYTAQENKKINKASNRVRKYTYYHCTNRKADHDCSQKKSIRKEDLEEMIINEISKFEILPEFKDWALEVLREENKKEVSDRKSVYNSQIKRKNGIQKELDKLMDMLLKEQINDEEYNKKRKSLLNEKKELSEQIGETDIRADNWLELMEKAFDFATSVSSSFSEGSNEVKAQILRSLGKSLIINNGVFIIEPNDWLVPIKEKCPKLKNSYEKLKLKENLVLHQIRGQNVL